MSEKESVWINPLGDLVVIKKTDKSWVIDYDRESWTWEPYVHLQGYNTDFLWKMGFKELGDL